MAWLFDTSDKDYIKQMIAREKGEPHHRRGVSDPELRINALSTFILVLDNDLPAASFDPVLNIVTVGQTTGAVWRRNAQATEESSQLQSNPTTNQLVPQREDDNTCVRMRIFNETAKGYPGCTLVKAVQDNYGDLYVTGAANESLTLTSGSPISSTSSTSSTTTTPSVNNPCTGSCTWQWTGTYWTLLSPGCTGITTTTTTSTSTTTTTTTSTTSTTPDPSTSTTTTLDPCVCQSTTTSSSTTGVPFLGNCQCTYPLFCGTTIGDCTKTTCVNGTQADPKSKCTSTSTSSTSSTTSPTTTCNCNTSTTAAPTTTGSPPPQCTSCTWYTDAFGFQSLISRHCDPIIGCYCDDPGGAGAPCTSKTLPCITTSPPPPPPPPFCVGGCTFICDPAFGWYYLPNQSGCACGGVPTGCPCVCNAPSFACTDCQAYTVTPCFQPTGSQTTTSSGGGTTAGPCSNCYTTTTSSTTSTTSTTKACTACEWKWNGSTWVLQWSNCGAGCTCKKPSYAGAATCEVADTPCVTTTTSTTSTTTTTTTTTSTTTTSTSTSSTTSTTTTSTTTTSTTSTSSTSSTTSSTTTADCHLCGCAWIWNDAASPPGWINVASCRTQPNIPDCPSCTCTYPEFAGVHNQIVNTQCRATVCGSCVWNYNSGTWVLGGADGTCDGTCLCNAPTGGGTEGQHIRTSCYIH